MLFEKQQYQTDCVSNITEILKQCDVFNSDFENLPCAIDTLWQENIMPIVKKRTNRKCLDVLMETGTGKTFTYLKTIFELHKQFNKQKFIIVVPRTAIKLGVIQNIKLTDEYFFNIYGRHLNYIDYPREGLSKIRNSFINSNDFSVLITTNAAFNSEKNNINKKEETLFDNGSTWQGIAAQKPIVIIDEPHLLKGNETKKGLEKLQQSLFIRFGATYPSDEEHTLANVAYCLDSISSFNQLLVKRIRVNTVINDGEIGALELIETKAREKKFCVTYGINTVPYTKEMCLNEDIGARTGLEAYHGISATKITNDTVSLDNHTTLKLSKGNYTLNDAEIESMLQKTIETHFSKEQSLFEQGIKTLSLFFIPKIDDFRESNNNPSPRIKTMFERIYKKMWKEHISKTSNHQYKQYLEKDFDAQGKLQVHEGYFSGDKVNKTQKDAQMNKEDIGVDIILNQKETLLSFDTQLRFIFSVWALQEGWDNPNVFNICKLSDTAKDISRRQQVGRGLRIALNQQGKRLTYNYLAEKEETFYDINTLDMIVSGKEKEFITQIQQEIHAASFSLVGDFISAATLKEKKGLTEQEAIKLLFILESNKIILFDEHRNEYKIISSIADFLQHNKKENLSALHLDDKRYQAIQALFPLNKQSVIDGNQRPKTVTIKQHHWQDFKALWETLNKKSKIVYKGIQEEALIQEVAQAFNQQTIPPMKTKTITQVYNTQKDRIDNIAETSQESINFFQTKTFNDFINAFVTEQHLPLAFVLKLINAIDIENIRNNPKKSQEILINILQDTIHSSIINQVRYEFSQTSIYPNSLQDNKGKSIKKILSTSLGQHRTQENIQEHLLYDTICYDSDIEKNIQQNDPASVNTNTVTVFAKLPQISIPTPYKHYNPDFAYLIERQDKKTLFLVVETKGYKSEQDIPEKEQHKIAYAERFFKHLQDECPDVEIRYNTRINAQGLTDLLSNKQ